MRNNWKNLTWSAALKAFLAIAVCASILTGCGSSAISYPLESVTQNGDQLSKIYRAENQTVPDVAKQLAADRTPDEMSKEDADRMFLVYPDELYHLQKDPNKPADTLVEVDNRQFVQQNYDSSFLKGYILASVLDRLFDTHRSYPGSYRGYSSRDVYKPQTVYHQPSTQEKKLYPPITKDGTGSIFKRGSKSPSAVGPSSSNDTSSKSGWGTIIKKSSSSDTSPKQSSIFSRARSNSPPKTKSGGFGRISRRR